jgi:hypothetical protein
VFKVRSEVGVKVATLPEQVTAPAIGVGVAPGPVTMKVVAGDASVMQLSGSLNVAVSA